MHEDVCVCMFVSVYMCKCVCMFVYVHVCVLKCVSECTRVCMCGGGRRSQEKQVY